MFKNPERKTYSAKPFWAWNGKLNKDELIRQIHIMKKMGFGGFFMHSRTGLETEYLGEEWFNLINECSDEAERLDMEAWLYDEDRWPSGSAGGIATREEKYRMQYIRMNIVIKSMFEWSDDIISAFAADVNGINFENCLRISKHTDINSLDVKNVIFFTTERMIPTDTYNGGAYLDTMSQEAVVNYINTTHDKYIENCSDRLGRTIKGIFTDEPHRGSVMCGFSVPNRDNENLSPYTQCLFSEFEKSFGYKLEDNLPELFLRKNGQIYSQVKWNYMELILKLFLNNFANQYDNWCKKNNMLSTGHVLHEDNLTSQTAMIGSVMRYYEYMDYPGVDVLIESNVNYCIVKQLSSVARQTGKKWMLSELNGCTGWQMTFEKYKNIGDWQAIMGINLRCPHLSWYTMKGEAKRDYPASILHQSSWHKTYSLLEDYYARIAEITSNSQRVCDTLIISPVESIWAQVYAGWTKSLETTSEEVLRLEQIFQNTYTAFFENHIDFDYADEEMLSRLYTVTSAILNVGEAQYKTVVVSGMVTMRKTTLEALKAFKAVGGRVVFIGEAPTYINALKSTDCTLFAKECEHMDLSQINMLSQHVKINSSDIILQTYKDEYNKYYFMLNKNRTEKLKSVKILFDEKAFLQEWSAVDGEKYMIESDCDNLTLNFEAGELKLIVDSGETLTSVSPRPNYKLSEIVYPTENVKIILDEPNVLVLDYVKFSVNDDEYSEYTEVLLADRKIRDIFNMSYRGGEMLQPWYTAKKDLLSKGKISLFFSFNIDFIPSSPVYLMYEESENFDVNINGKQINKNFKDGVFIDVCFSRVDISSLITLGTNNIILTTQYKENSNVEAIYILGDFAVSYPEKTIIKQNNNVKFGKLNTQGFPFYGGKITYQIEFDRKLKENETAFIKLDKYENNACFEIDGKYFAFAPYTYDVSKQISENGICEISLYLTRRNMFGPLHGITKYSPWIGPGEFYGGESKEYVLYDSGILKKPHLEIMTDGGAD